MDARKIGAIAAAILFVACTSALAAPEMVHMGVTQLGPNDYMHNYELRFPDLDGCSERLPVSGNSGNPEVTDFTVNRDVQVTSSWIHVWAGDWETTLVTDNSHSRIDPEESGVEVGTVWVEFGIEASVPYVTDSIIKYTDNPLVMPGDGAAYEAAIFHISTMQVPGPIIPEPAGLSLMGLAFLAVRKRRR